MISELVLSEQDFQVIEMIKSLADLVKPFGNSKAVAVIDQWFAEFVRAKLLKEMFANLLVSDMNTATKSKVHPKFASVLADMSVAEAKFLQAFKETYFLPMLEPNDKRRLDHIDIIYHPTFYSTGLSYEEIGQAILSLRSNGVLLPIPDYSVNLDPEPNNPYSEWCKNNNPCWGSYLYQPIKLSPFGKDFCQVVLSEAPPNA
jgi:hypothetical protein